MRLRFLARSSLCALLVVSGLGGRSALLASPQLAGASGRRCIRIGDAVAMTRIADPDGPIASFSPDGRLFTILVKKGNLSQNTNDFSLLFYRTADVLHDPSATVLLERSSSSNRAAIQEVKWLADSKTVVFLGEAVGSLPQVYSVDVQTRRVRQLTHSKEIIRTYDVSADGMEIAYVTDQPPTELEKVDAAPLVIVNGRKLPDWFSGTCKTRSSWPRGEALYLQHGQRSPRPVSITDDYIAAWSREVHMSPDGKHCLIGVLVRQVQSNWGDYRDRFVQLRVQQTHAPGTPIFYLERYLVVDTGNATTKPLLNTPMTQFAKILWSSDSQSILLKNVWLPLQVADAKVREERTRKTYDVKVDVDTGELQKIRSSDWPDEDSGSRSLRISVKEDRNTPPMIYGSQDQGAPKLVLDLNPWLETVELSHVEVIRWKNDVGQEKYGELFLPAEYLEGVRYPLVIQTHGFAPERFMMDGPFESSAFAAEALAARGMVVLQMDYDRSTENTVKEGPAEMAEFASAIDDLDKKGMIDRDRVGIIGFSRTVFQVGYALTHSTFGFRAASLVDGIDGGYLQYLIFGPGDTVHLNGGLPQGEVLRSWLVHSPSFNLGDLRTPVRLEAHGCSGGILTLWEWYALLSDMNRPVEFVYLPDADHIPDKPREKLAAEREVVDWFTFWLFDGSKDSLLDPEELQRWGALRTKPSIGRPPN